MGQILAVTLPLYILIAIGWLAVRCRYLAAADLVGASRVVMQVFLPAMIFLAIASRPLREALHPGFLAAYTLAPLAAMALAWGLARLSGQGPAAAAIEGMGASCPNSGYFGLPLVTLTLGAGVATQAFALAVVVENLLVIPIAIALCDLARGGGGRGLRGFVLPLVRNPMLIAVAAGLAWSAGGVPLPALAVRVLQMMVPVAAPLVLVAIGAALAGMSPRAEVAGAARVSLGKLVVHPLLAFGLAALLAPGLEAPMRAALVLYAASPMMTIYTLFGQRYGQEGLAVTAMLAAITASVVTVPLVVWLVERAA